MELCLFIGKSSSSFELADFNILSNKYLVKSHYSNTKGIINTLKSQYNILKFLLPDIFKAKLIYIWFSGYHAFLPSLIGLLLNKKVFIVIGGYDAARFKQYNHGANIKLLERLVGNLSCILAKRLLPVSNFTRSEMENNLVNGLLKKTVMIYNCINLTNKDFEIDAVRSVDFVTVSYINTYRNFMLKGIDLFIKIAEENPQLKFLHIGMEPDYLTKAKIVYPNNIEWISPISHNQISKYLLNSKFYLQCSRYESFGIGLLEGMFSGCIPIGMDCAATPELLGDNGILFRENEIDKIKVYLKNLDVDNSLRKKCRDHVIKNFSVDKRKNGIFNLV